MLGRSTTSPPLSKPPSQPPSPPSPLSSPPGTFKSTASLKAAIQAFHDDETAATATYGPIADWDVSAISDMSELFRDSADFNSDISSWETSGVTTMRQMFRVRSARALAPQP
eukprot:scaffold51015_cov63-Phaeocystis_antarctica.AAC.2